MLRKFWTKLVFIVLGLGSTIWFLVRVIPKPSRATYPCMRAAAPFMSSFVIWLISLTGTALAYKKMKEKVSRAKYIPAFGFFVALVVMLVINDMAREKKSNALDLVDASYFVANEPMGVAQGYKPGRVAWVWNQEATNENLEIENKKDNWWVNHTNASAVQSMMDDILLLYTDESTVAGAWDVLFKHFNNNHDRGETGYSSGEKIFIKINTTNSAVEGSSMAKTKNWNRMDSTPEVMLALLKQLIEVVGVEQSDIFLGDPFRNFRDEYWDVCHSVYPKVNYVDGRGIEGRYQTTPTEEPIMKFSDGKYNFHIPQEYVDATYFINLPALKSHDSAGITLGVKNHQGSVLKPGDQPKNQSAYDMHYAFPDNDNKEGGSHRYRHIVDYAGHEQLGGKTLLTIVDGIWAGRRWEGFVERWQSAPFNGDFPNSLFISQDLLAIESVCFDFLLEEYRYKSDNDKYPYMSGTDDYLLQAADPANWAEGITYDPEGDGTPITSLGVYEHWNNSTDKQYTRNLGTGAGVELISAFQSVSIANKLTTENGLPSNVVKSIYVDSANVAWIGTDKGLARLDGVTAKVYDSETHLKNNQVNDIAFEETSYNDELWLATDGGLTVAAFDTDGITAATTYLPSNSDIVGSKVLAVMVDEDHNRWIGTDSAVNVFKGSDWLNLTQGVSAYGDIYELSEVTVTDIENWHADTARFALVATNGEGVLRLYNDEVDGITGASTFGLPWSSLNDNHVTAVSASGIEQWYGTIAGVNEHTDDQAKGDWMGYTLEENKLESNHITDVLIDTDKNVWIGTMYGLNIIKTDETIFKYTEEQGLINNEVNVIEMDTKGNVWVGTTGGVEWFKEIPGIDVTTSSPFLAMEGNSRLYPNPATRFINLEINIDRPQFVRVAIYNLQGQLIDIPVEEKVRDSQSTKQIDISDHINYKKGIYLVSLETEDYRQILKFNKQ